MQSQKSASNASPVTRTQPQGGQVAGPLAGKPFTVASGFEALSFHHAMFGGLMDPLVMVDHYTMSEPTFGPHPHAGMSAVSLLFEDSRGSFNNRDSLGNDIDLEPGDLYWLNAGSGAVHDEKPVRGAIAHGLQMFVNLPARMKRAAPETLHVKASQMPLIEKDGAKVRLVLGESNGLAGATSPALPMTILDAMIAADGELDHEVAPGHAQWIYAVNGCIDVSDGKTIATVSVGEALAVGAIEEHAALHVRGRSDSHFVLVTGEPIGETFVQRGPFVMSNEAEIVQLEADYREGRLGGIAA